MNYNPNNGDLFRIGYIYNEYPNYRDQFKVYYDEKIRFNYFSQDSLKKEYDILILGDSYSEFGSEGYQNFISKKYGKSVLHIDFKFHNNPFQFLVSLINSDFFETYKIKNIVLERAERDFVKSSISLDLNSKFDLLNPHIRLKPKSTSQYSSILSSRIFKFPISRIFREVFPEKLIYAVYSRQLTANFFSTGDSTLYFYYRDVENINLNNDKIKLKKLNDLLNALNDSLIKNGVNLIVIPIPDKYHFYNNYLKDANEFGQCYFFENYSNLDKRYGYVSLDNYKTIKDRIHDFYYYDDSHLSPKGNEFLASQIIRFIK